MTAAQVSATRKSRATQAASSTTRIASAVRATVLARESKGNAAFSEGRSALPSLFGTSPEWRSMVGPIPCRTDTLIPSRRRPAAEAPLHLGALMAINKLGLAINLAIKTHHLDNHHYVSGRSRLSCSNRYSRPHHASVD
jgi:hypothetical protein